MELQEITRRHGSFTSLRFTVDVTPIGKTVADIEDVVWVVKEKKGSRDHLMLKRMADGITINQEGVVIVPWGHDEYENICAGNTYVGGLYCKFNGDPTFNEDVQTEFKVMIVDEMLSEI